MLLEIIELTIARLTYREDVRLAPDEMRRGQFRTGWEDATRRGKHYADNTLTQLTWRNLGYRFGKVHGEQKPEQIDAIFDTLAERWQRDREARDASERLVTPSPGMYVTAFRSVDKITDSQIQMLRVHYHSTARTVTARQLASVLGYSHYSLANSNYGRLGRLVGDKLKYNPMKERLGTLVTFERRQGEWHWLMRPEVAQALEVLGWVDGTEMLLPEEIEDATSLVEGATCQVTVNSYERNPEARRRCIEEHGTVCCICRFDFGAVYGEVAKGLIHVHHLRPLSEIGGEYIINPVEDLRPVCPNCHAVLHRRIPAYGIDEVRAFLRQSASQGSPHTVEVR